MGVNHLNALKSNEEIVINIVPKTWYGRVLSAIVIGLMFLMAYFVFTLFLIVGSVLAIILMARILWVFRKSKKNNSENIVDVEISIER